MPTDSDCTPPPEPQLFATTRWSVVLASGSESPGNSERALEELCRAYWYPLYVFLRRQGRSAEDAQDLTQSFLAHLLQNNRLQRVAPEKGRFRSFLLASLGHFICDQLDKARALKRGGGAVPVALDGLKPEERYAIEPADFADPAAAYDRRWALTLVERATQRLERENADPARRERFERLVGFLGDGSDESTYAEAAGDLGITEGAVKVAVLRLRQRFRVLFREEIAETVAAEGELDPELKHILAVLSQ